MKLITKTLPDNQNLFLFGDEHEGSCLSSQSAWEALVDMINSKYEECDNNYAASTGDEMEAIMVDDRRYSADKLHPPEDKPAEPLPLTQARIAIVRRKPIAKQLLYMLEGNHNRTLWRFGNMTEFIAGELGVPYGTYTTKLTVRTGGFVDSPMYKLFHTHGSRTITSTADDPIRRRTNMELILKRQLKFKAGDCAVMVKGHAHKLLVTRPEANLYLVDDGEKIKQRYTGGGQREEYIHPDARWYGCTGSLLRLYLDGVSGYAELGEYDPVEIGCLVLMVRDRQIVELRRIVLPV